MNVEKRQLGDSNVKCFLGSNLVGLSCKFKCKPMPVNILFVCKSIYLRTTVHKVFFYTQHTIFLFLIYSFKSWAHWRADVRYSIWDSIWEVYHRALQRWRTRVSVSPCRLSKKPGDNKAKKSKQVSQKYTASRLHEKGVLISIDDLQPNQWVAPPAGHRILSSLKLRLFVLPWDGELTVSRFESWSLVLSLFLLFSSQVQECYFWNFSVGGCRGFRG